MDIPVLYAEDDANDRLLVERVFAKARPDVKLRCVAGGPEAINYLKQALQARNQGDHSLPELVMLDIQMPFLSGLQVLAWMRTRDEFKELPVVIVSSSERLEDRTEAHRLGAAGFVVKQGGFTDLPQQVERWL